ncbi:MAG: hypothetical protein KDE56_06850 [Anaerolineales bacterium]|nr:hypothetical protein [Anaerolineales bacterium]MCA9995444.1 hypothetical protein [Anaerolineales bacterium]
MTNKQAEYDSLRTELISHQSRRESAMSIGLTLSIALIAAGIELKNPYILLSVLLILFAIRVQITHIHSGIQRIATYLRVAHEENNPDLNWETTSYQVRLASLENQSPRVGKMSIFVTPAFSPMEYVIGLTGIVAIVAAWFNAQTVSNQTWRMVLIAGGIWVVAWIIYGFRTRQLHSMKMEENEAQSFREILQRELLPVVHNTSDEQEEEAVNA